MKTSKSIPVIVVAIVGSVIVGLADKLMGIHLENDLFSVIHRLLWMFLGTAIWVSTK